MTISNRPPAALPAYVKPEDSGEYTTIDSKPFSISKQQHSCYSDEITDTMYDYVIQGSLIRFIRTQSANAVNGKNLIGIYVAI